MVLATMNKPRGASDHNETSACIRIKGLTGNRLETFTRKRCNFELERYREKLRSCQWEDLYKITNTSRANKWLVEKLTTILQEECPLIKVQPNKKLKSWVSTESVRMFKERDSAREKAKISDLEEDWNQYRRLRNDSTKALRSDKKKHFEELYSRIQNQNDTKSLYRITRQQLGWQLNGPPQQLVSQGRKITAPKLIAQEQMNYFSAKIESLMAELPRPTEDPLKILNDSMRNWTNAAKQGHFQHGMRSQKEILRK